MKKLISLILATVMVLSTMVMLIPVASAAETVDLTPNGGAGKVYYEQDFDDPALADLVDADLANALGITVPDKTATIFMEDGALRIVAQYTASGVYPPTENKWGDGYAFRWVRDDDLIQNATVVEYTVTSYRRAPAPENDVTVTLKDGTQKTVKADGQGGYQGFGAYYQDWAGTDNYLIRFNPAGDGQKNTFKMYDKPGQQGAMYWKTGAYSRVGTIPEGDVESIEYYNNPVVTNESAEQLTGKYFNKEYHIKHIVEPHGNRCYTFINGVLVETLNPAGPSAGTTGTQYTANEWRKAITKYIGFHAKPGSDLKLDNIKVSEFVPALTISEVMTNGIATDNAKGKYQWVEITNPGDAPVNVYDYALETCMGNAAQTIGDEVVMYKDYSGSTIGYFTPGAKAVGSYTFDSPAYADGVLQPGESAVVLVPYTAVQGGLDTSDEAFRAYLKGLGMDDSVKTFVADNAKNTLLISHAAGESFTLSILKVKNKAAGTGYDPEVVALGQPTWYMNAFAECTTIITAKTAGGTQWFGMSIHESNHNGTTWVNGNSDKNGDGFMGHMPLVSMNADAYNKPATDHSYEINYSGWYAEAPHASIQWGFAKYRTDMARKNAAGADVYATPGFVPVDCRRTVDVTLVKDGKTEGIQGARLLTDSTVTFTAPAAKAGFAIDAYLGGALYAEDVTAETAVAFAIDGEKLTNASNIDVEFKYRALGANIIGIQKADDNTIRILAGVSNLDLENDTLGITFIANYWGVDSDTIEYECAYVYTAVTVDGAVKTAASYGYDYLFALHINNAPLDALESDLIITAEANLNGEPSPIGSVEFTFSLDEVAA